MNIQDVELRTGLERANVRYYEKEGLLNPGRLSNGYRDYSEADVETLLRIKLLRELEVSVAEIAQLQTNEAALQDVISLRLENLHKERAALARERKICETMQSDGVVYDTLEAKRYLQQLEDLRQQDWGVDPTVGWGKMTSHLKQDVAPPDLRPGQRFAARQIDGLLYFVLWITLYCLVFRTTFVQGSAVMIHLMFVFLLWILLEPTQLAFFGTTAGKCIIGMRVHTDEGEKLDWWQAWSRMWKMIWKSSTMFSNRYWHRIWYGDYWPYHKENGFPWDEETSYSFRDEKPWRLPVAIACIVALALLPGVIDAQGRKLEHQGPMTVAEFAENYNKYVDLEGGGREYVLDQQGQWVKGASGTAYVYVDDGEGSHEARFPQFIYTEEDGYLTGIAFEVYRKGEDGEWLPGNFRNILNVVMAYAVPFVGHQSSDLIEAEIEQNYMHSYSFQMGDLTIAWEVKTLGYRYNEGIGVYVPMDEPLNEDRFYHLIFEIKTTE